MRYISHSPIRGVGYLALIGLALLLYGCGKDGPEVTWQDGSQRIYVTAQESQSVMSRTKTMLHVVDTTSGEDNSVMLDDDVAVTQLRLVEFDGWVLVINGHLVLGGVHLSDRRLVGDHQWDELPFTQWEGEGKVLAEGSVRSKHESDRPAGFTPRRLQTK